MTSTPHEHISTYSRPGLIRAILAIPQDIVNFLDGDDISHVSLSHAHHGGDVPHHHDVTPMTGSDVSGNTSQPPMPTPIPAPTPEPSPAAGIRLQAW